MNLLCGTRPWTETVWRTLRTTHPECEWWMARTMRDLTWKLEASPPWVFVLHWHWKIPAMWLSRARWIGFHASDLPHFRGGSPIRNQQQRGITTTQLTAFQLEAGLDTGPIVLQRPLSLAGSEAAVLARQAGAEKLAVLAKGGDAGLQWAAAKTVSRREAQGLAPAALRRIMTADASKLPAHAGVERGDQGYALYRISKVIPGEFKAGPQTAEALALADRQAGADQLDAYVASLRARAKVEINRANLEKK